jgi:hypothetical protein
VLVTLLQEQQLLQGEVEGAVVLLPLEVLPLLEVLEVQQPLQVPQQE